MAKFPSTVELMELYRDVMENEAVTAISHWTLQNTDEPTDEVAYVENADRIAPGLFPVIDGAIQKI